MASDPRHLSDRAPDQLETAVRVFTARQPHARAWAQEGPPAERADGDAQVRVWRDYPHEALVFDTETLPGPAQQLRFLVWRLYRDAHDRPPAVTCAEEGIAYPDDLPTTAPADFALLQQYAAGAAADVAPGFPIRLELRPLSWWLNERLFRYAYAHRDRCALVGFNLLFDLGRLASYWGKAEGAYRGGYSLGLWGHYDRAGTWRDMKHRSRLRLRAIDPRRTLFRWGSRGNDPDPQRGPGRFVDLRTLTFALTDRSLTLERACAAFGDPYEKQEVDYETLTSELLDYAREDVAHTALLYRNCLIELARHQGVHLEPHRLYSPATVGARYLEAMGVRRPLVKFTGLSEEELGWRQPRQRRHAIDPEEPRGKLDPAVLGYAMSAFYGGRAEARIVRTAVPIVLVDFTSMYPSVNALLGTWSLLTARALRVADATEEVRELLAQPDLLEQCLTPELWGRIGVTLVEIEPDGDVLPVRAAYEPEDPAELAGNGQPAAGGFGIGVNPLWYVGRLWYALPDLIAAVLLSPHEHGTVTQPRVVRALRLEPVGKQPGLQPVRLRGGELVDPRRQDPFVRMIEERQRVLRDTTLDNEEKNRLDKFLKITANATAYGVLARFDRREPAKPIPVIVYGPDEEPTDSPASSPEDPGPFCFPPVACSITAAARLMLALLERLVRDKGGQYAFCDTDSMAIVATPKASTVDCSTADGRNAIRALSWQQLRAILRRFDQLNPYDRTLVASPWKVEQESMTRPLWCYAISAKRYCLYRPGNGGQAELLAAVDSPDQSETEASDALKDALADWSEHGLGLYLDPTSADPDRPQRDDKGRRLWVAAAWQWILADANRASPPLPTWADCYALTRFTVSSPRLEQWFAGYNESRPRDDWIRPGSFGLLAHPAELGERISRLPAAPYERDPERWPTLDWYDRRTGQQIRVTSISAEDDPDARAYALARGDVPIQTLGDILSRYRSRPEHKSLAPDGEPAGPETIGLLQRRPVKSSPENTDLTGKEGSKLEERATAEVHDAADYLNRYGCRASTWPLVVEVLKEIGAPAVARATGASRQAMYDVLDGALPRRKRRHELERIAASRARQQLLEWQIEPPATEAALLRLYLTEREGRRDEVRRCEWCGEPIPAELRVDARYCKPAHRKAAQRARQTPQTASLGLLDEAPALAVGEPG
jgi:hypothetical protein